MNHNWEQNQATEIDPDDKTSRKNVRITIVNTYFICMNVRITIVNTYFKNV